MSIAKKIETLYRPYCQKKPTSHQAILNSKESLQKLTKFFDQEKIPYYSVFGTLLSCVREQSLFSHDHDIDLAIHDEDLDRLAQVLPSLFEHGFMISELGWSVIKLRSLPVDSHIDIWIIEPTRNPIFRYFNKQWRLDHALFPYEYFNKKEKSQMSCYNFSVNIPNNAIQLLEEWYGPEWTIPKKNAFAEYRAIFSRIISFPFLESVMPFRFSNNPNCCYLRPWLRLLVSIINPKSKWAKKPNFLIK